MYICSATCCKRCGYCRAQQELATLQPITVTYSYPSANQKIALLYPGKIQVIWLQQEEGAHTRWVYTCVTCVQSVMSSFDAVAYWMKWLVAQRKTMRAYLREYQLLPNSLRLHVNFNWQHLCWCSISGWMDRASLNTQRFCRSGPGLTPASGTLLHVPPSVSLPLSRLTVLSIKG